MNFYLKRKRLMAGQTKPLIELPFTAKKNDGMEVALSEEGTKKELQREIPCQ